MRKPNDANPGRRMVVRRLSISVFELRPPSRKTTPKSSRQKEKRTSVESLIGRVLRHNPKLVRVQFVLYYSVSSTSTSSVAMHMLRVRVRFVMQVYLVRDQERFQL